MKGDKWKETNEARDPEGRTPPPRRTHEGRQIKRETQKAGHHHPEGHMKGDKWRETNKATDPERRTRPVTQGRTPLKKELRTPTVNCLGKNVQRMNIQSFSGNRSTPRYSKQKGTMSASVYVDLHVHITHQHVGMTKKHYVFQSAQHPPVLIRFDAKPIQWMPKENKKTACWFGEACWFKLILKAVPYFFQRVDKYMIK